MSLLADWEIKALAKAGMISDFQETKVKVVDGNPVISFGLQSFGYDIRIADEFKVFRVPLDHSGIVDPKNMEPRLLQDFRGEVCIIPPNSFALARSIERFTMPPNVTGIVLGKSTYARCGIVANFTPLEAGWSGIITIEISNTSKLPAKVYANEGFAQVLFMTGNMPDNTYGEGKYQNQEGITLAKV